MADDEKSKLYKQVIQRASNELMLDRMRMHGFWPQDEPLPPDPPAEANERKEIEAELEKLRESQGTAQDAKKALAEERKRRWEESKKRRAEKKKEREAAQTAKREAWESERVRTIVHAGEGVSGGLQHRWSDSARLQTAGLPVLNDAPDLASAIGIDLTRLRWLTFHRRGAALVHYQRYQISKKSGGQRWISAPAPALKHAQRWVLENILNKIDLHPSAHGFASERSIKSNALPHCGQRVVINLDLKDFFPSVTFRRVKGMFVKFGYSEHIATLLALLSTEPPRAEIELRGKKIHVALGERVLPQGACTSPAITNVLCRRFDRRMAGAAKHFGYDYTRYADDLTFSTADLSASTNVGKLLAFVRKIIGDEGFIENAAKTRVMRSGSRQEVTGLAVNGAQPTLSRKERRKLRAILHNAAKHGLESQNRDNLPGFAEHLRGKVAYAAMVDPERATQWFERLNRAIAR